MADETPSRPVGRPRKDPTVVRLNVDNAVIRDAAVKSWKPADANDGWIPVKAARAAMLPASVAMAHNYAYYADDGAHVVIRVSNSDCSK